MKPAQNIFAPTSTKPNASLTASPRISGLQLLRNNFTIQTWLLLGMAIQALLIALPIRKLYATSPAFLFLAYSIIDHTLMVYGLKKNPYMAGVILGKTTAVLPGSLATRNIGDATTGPAPSSDKEEIVVILLCARSNHPFGVLSPVFRKTGAYLDHMTVDLESHAAEYGWLGGTSWLNSADRASTNELMMVHYFKTYEGMSKFAHGSEHRNGWDWYNKFNAEVKASGSGAHHLSFTHEVYTVGKGGWENIYLNSTPSGLGTTVFPVESKDGATMWQSPLIDASRGKLRSSRGRMGLIDTEGKGNEKYGDEPYDAVAIV